jgi:ribosomal protein L18
VLASASTVEKELREQLSGNGGNAAAAALVGKRIAEKAKAAGVEKVAFDRAGFAYHGRVKALADARAKPACSSDREGIQKWQSSLPALRPKAMTTA